MRFSGILAAFAIIAATTAVLAQADQREPTMKKVGRAYATLNKMNRGQEPYDGAKAAAAFEAISENAKHFGTLFPAGGKPEGRALASIWENKADFDARIAKLSADAAAAAPKAAKGEAEFKAGFAAIQPQCGSCHKIYRGED
jgi:cytochrome c556